MLDEISGLLDEYQSWLRNKTKLRQIQDWVEITTPYLDRHNDYIQIYVVSNDGGGDGFVLSDDGYILDDLEMSGCKIDSPKRRDLLTMTLNGFGVHLNNNAIEVRASTHNFALRKHNLVQAMLAVNDLFYLASPKVTALFYEEVSNWLDLSDVRYTPNIKLTGKSGYDHVFNFVIPKSKQQPERILRAINSPNRNDAQAMAFSWLDTREVRSTESRAYAFLNDSSRSITGTVVEAMRNYEINPVLWSDREQVREELAA